MLHLPQDLPAPTVVCCHGMLSSKDSIKFVAIAQGLCDAGLAAVRFDFSGCGESRTVFLESLLDTRKRDLRAVISYVRQQPWADGHLGLLGSSLGGALALLTAAQEQDIEALVCWATPFDLMPVHLALEAGRLRPCAFPQGIPLGVPQNLEMLPPIPRTLIIHGQHDEIVNWHEASRLYRQLGEPKQLLLFETADHRLLDASCRQLAIHATVGWFQQFLPGSLPQSGRSGG
jgi:uncharacterized protein